MSCNDRNYFNDFRVVAANKRSMFDALNSRRMLALVTLFNEEGDEEQHEVPYKLGVCPTCEGKGSHVNPGIDAHGIGHTEWAEWDQDDRDTYQQGGYDVCCYECHGEKVVPEIDTARVDPEILRRIHEKEQDERDTAAEYAAERAMGA
jgi:hypothetical protein